MNEQQVTADDIREAIRNVPDFPKEGIQFKDITPVLADGRLFAVIHQGRPIRLRG